jgi:hypothetical protein
MRITDNLPPNAREKEENIYSKLLAEGESFYEEYGTESSSSA